MEIKDKIWGIIEIDELFQKIIETKEFKNLYYIKQLGLTKTASHTRADHSLGVHHLAKQLIKICEKKFGKIIKFSEHDKNAILLMALVHDIGHGPYSHVSEHNLDGSHEENTINILKDINSEIHNVIKEYFSEDVLDKVINIIISQKNIKQNNEDINSIDLTYIVGKLLSGGIDVDRLDYIPRDAKELKHDNRDFSVILENIDLEFIDNSLEIVYDSDIEYDIANFFNTRFEMYDKDYYGKEIKTLEKIFSKFIKLIEFDLRYSTTEVELENIFRTYINHNNPIISRYAKLLFYKNLDNQIIVNEYDSILAFENMNEKLNRFVPEIKDMDEALIIDHISFKIYSSNNKVYMKKNGIIKEISEYSKILNSNLSKNKHILSIDIYNIIVKLRDKGYNDIEIKEIISRIYKSLGAEIEQEKKYELIDINNDDTIKQIINRFSLQNSQKEINMDIYYDDEFDTLKDNGINLRRREINGEIEVTIKKNLEDNSSLSKRKEIPFLTLEEAIEYVNKNWNLNIKNLKDKISIHTTREKYILEVYFGKFEIAYDCSKVLNNISDEYYIDHFKMIECEYKSGSTVGLYFINEILKQNINLTESNNTKKDIAFNIYQNNKNIQRIKVKEE